MTLSSRTTTILAVLLVASLAVNFFIAGVIFSRFDRPHFRMMGPRAENSIFMRGGPGGLSEEGRDVIRQAMQGHGDSIRLHAEAMGKAQDAIRQALRAKPFDAQALAEAQKEMRQAVDAIQTAMQENFNKVAAKLSDKDRAALANMPVQSPVMAFRHRDFGPGSHGKRMFFHRDLPSGASPPPASDGGR
jgi:uncharacterized membrane protein